MARYRQSNSKTLAIYGPLVAVAAVMAVAATTGDAAGTTGAALEAAAAPSGDVTGDPAKPTKKRRLSGKRIIKLQKALSEMGLYLGPIDGILNEGTEAAIRVYQRAAGLKADGRITKRLWDLIENNVKVRSLLRKLDTTRQSRKDEARKALLSHPATRDLVRDANTERADPTRDASQCFREPTARCLLNEASESAKAIFRPELRDWALGEVLVAQARAGLTEQAMDTVRRIQDPRLIMVALRDIAEAQAAAGRSVEAMEAVDIIPDKLKQAEALAAIADIQVRRGRFETARETANYMLRLSDRFDDDLKRISFKARVAVIMAQAGDDAAAASQLAEAETLARARDDDPGRGMALRYVASALAEMEQPDQALNVLSDVTEESERMPVLVSTATAQARAGDAAAALATASTIEAVRYRAVVLGRIALAQAEMNEREAAESTLQMAMAAVEQIELPYARSYAISRIALAMAEVGAAPAGGADAAASFERPVEVAGRIDDNRLRAHTLWTIAAEQRRAGDRAGGLATEALAEAATEEIRSKLSRVWMFSEIAAEHAVASEPNTGWQAFGRGLAVAEAIDNAWGRARAMAKLGTTVIELVDPSLSVATAP